MTTIRVKENPKYQLIHKVGSITLEYGVKGSELERELRLAQEDFVRAMELRGMILYRRVGFNNPVWVMQDGEPLAFYAIDWDGKRKTGRKLGPDGLPLPKEREYSLEDSEGEVEYRVIGIFYAPERAIEIMVDVQDILDKEKIDRNPIQFGYGKLPNTGAKSTKELQDNGTTT